MVTFGLEIEFTLLANLLFWSVCLNLKLLLKVWGKRKWELWACKMGCSVIVEVKLGRFGRRLEKSCFCKVMRTVWLGSAARRGLLPSLHLHNVPGPLCRVRCCADVHAMKLVDKEYAELALTSIQNQVGGVRVRQHVNPFKGSLTAPTVPPAWETEFVDPALPLHVDIGCGSGRLLMVLAKRSVDSCNFLGVDIRDKLLQRSTLWAEELSLTNIHFMVANATLALDAILLKYPGPLRLVSILCPDPHFKQKHRKRRIVQKSLVDALEKHLPAGGQIFLQSDVEEVAKDMRDQFDENEKFTRVHSPGSTMCDSEG